MTMTRARDLADRFHERWLEKNPFAATIYGVVGYDDLVPDASEEGERVWADELRLVLREVGAIAREELTPADAVTVDCIEAAASHEIDSIDLAGSEHTVTAMQFSGPASLLSVAARTVLVSTEAAEAYLTRLRRSGTLLDQLADRLRAGAAGGRLPVAPLAEQAVTWAE